MAVKSSFLNMVLALGTITLVCSALLAGVYVLTAEPIAKAAEAKTQAAIAAVLPDFESLETKTAEDGSTYTLGYDAEGNVVGVVVNASSVGFGGPIRMMVGFRPDGTIYNTSVLEHSETPGLGAKCTGEFAEQFKGFDPAVKTLKVSKDGGDVDAITASTITSRAYCVALENAVAAFRAIACEPAPCEVEVVEEVIVTENEEEQSNE